MRPTTSTTKATLQRLTLAMRREDPNRIWERRAPLTPDAVHDLVHHQGVDVLVQPCERRVYPAKEYEKAGATITSSFDRAHVVLGIKETPIDELACQRSPVFLPTAEAHIPRAHIMFSHTAKGQPYNTGLLSHFVAPTYGPSATSFQSAAFDNSNLMLWPRLIDYELLTDDEGKRTVGFGWFAGVAGVLESLSAMAHAHLELGIASPFLYTPRPHTLPSLDRLRSSLRQVGTWISTQGTPQSLGPIVICVTGTGNVARGCLSMLEELPIKRVDARDLHRLVSSGDYDNTKIYLVHATPKDYFVRKDGKPYDRQDYYANPSQWQSVFGETIMPYVTLLLNGAGWSKGFPRLLSTQQLATALAKAQSLGSPSAITRGRCIGDISCDIHGGLEFLEQATTLSEPTYKFSVSDNSGNLIMMSVDILPSALPLDASKHFSKEFYPYLTALTRRIAGVSEASNEWKGGKQDDKLSRALERATIASEGRLRDKHTWLQANVDTWHAENRVAESQVHAGASLADNNAAGRKKRVLMLGSGMVAGPAVKEIASRSDVELVIASNMLGEVQQLAARYGQSHKNNVNYRIIDVAKRETYEHLIKEADVVISLLPAAFHVPAAEMCIENRKHLVTASYISEGMRSLHERAIQADVLLLNEIGLDPGIDHCSAISLVDDLKTRGKDIVSFTSFCGGFPAPDAVYDLETGKPVPLKYKFSWSPVGVLKAANQGVRYLLAGKVVRLLGTDLLRSAFPRLPIPLMRSVELEGIPNRDSLPYRNTYGLNDASGLRTLVRGTLRYPGFCELMQFFKDLGLLEDDRRIKIDAWGALLPKALALKLNSEGGFDVDMDNRSVEAVIKDAIPFDQSADVAGRAKLADCLDALDWLGLWSPSDTGRALSSTSSSSRNLPAVPTGAYTPLEFFAMVLASKLRYAPDERDMVVLSHEVIASDLKHGNDISKEEIYRSTLVAYSNEEGSAMARTVGLPVAFAALDVLDGKIGIRGVSGPGEKQVYMSVLNRLEECGLGMVESVDVVRVGSSAGTVEESLRLSSI